MLSAVAFGGIVFGLSRVGAAAGSDVVPALVALAVGLAALVAFVRRQRRLQAVDAALLDLRTFASPTFTVAVVVMALSMMALFGTIILLPLYAQTVLGLEALQVGLLLLPGGLLMGLLAPSVGRAYDRFGPRVLLVPGTAVVSAARGASWRSARGARPWLVRGGVPRARRRPGPHVHAAVHRGARVAAAHLYSHGSAVVGTVQQVAGAAGTALFVTVLTVRASAATAAGAGPVAAMADGVHAAFLVGAAISVLAVPAALAVRVRAGGAEGDDRA